MSSAPSPPPLTAWQPMTVADVDATFRALGVPWWIAGGWALDLFLGRQTREHADIDIAMLRSDHAALRALRDEFEMYVPHDGGLELWHGTPLPESRHQFWVHRRGEDAWCFEVLLEEYRDAEWLFRRDPEIVLPLSEFGTSASGVAIVAPRVALLYKSNRPDAEKNERDFRSSLPELATSDRDWLRTTLQAVYGAHPWIAALS